MEFLIVHSLITGNVIGHTAIPSITDHVRPMVDLNYHAPHENFRPTVNNWVENNTGPLLPAYESPDEIDFRKTSSHLSRAGNPNLLGIDTQKRVMPEFKLPEGPKYIPIPYKPPEIDPVIQWRLDQTRRKQERKMADLGIDLSPVARVRGKETIYENAGHSHFSHVKDKGYHVTVQIPGLGKAEGLKNGLVMHGHVHEERPESGDEPSGFIDWFIKGIGNMVVGGKNGGHEDDDE